ncbi:MAG TPA: anti-sigma factor [Kofleriaceae bacterium]|nr:anti-sigma factor [Kofleriaceae bacterium]
MTAMNMPTQCTDIETLLPTYLDGELAAHDRLSFEHHMADCAACRDRMVSEGAYQARVRELLTAPPAPDGLADRVRGALDREEEQVRTQRRRLGRSWALPGVSVVAAAAALVLFLATESRGPDSASGDAEVQRGASAAERSLRLPLSLSGLSAPNESKTLGTWRPRKVEFDVELRDGRSHKVFLQLVGCRGLDLRGTERVVVAGTELRIGRVATVTNVTYERGAGLCFVFTSDLQPEQLVAGVMRLGLIRP